LFRDLEGSAAAWECFVSGRHDGFLAEQGHGFAPAESWTREGGDRGDATQAHAEQSREPQALHAGREVDIFRVRAVCARRYGGHGKAMGNRTCMRLSGLVLIAATCPYTLVDAEELASSKTVIGETNSLLADGAAALQAGRIEEGVRLTLEGLKGRL